MLSTAVEEELRQRLEQIAEREERPISQVIRMAIREFIERHSGTRQAA